MKAGSIFDNVLVTDDAEYARAFAEKTWGASRCAEKAMFDEAKKKQQEEDDAEAKRLAAEAAPPPATRTSSGTITTTPSPRSEGAVSVARRATTRRSRLGPGLPDQYGTTYSPRPRIRVPNSFYECRHSKNVPRLRGSPSSSFAHRVVARSVIHDARRRSRSSRCSSPPRRSEGVPHFFDTDLGHARDVHRPVHLPTRHVRLDRRARALALSQERPPRLGGVAPRSEDVPPSRTSAGFCSIRATPSASAPRPSVATPLHRRSSVAQRRGRRQRRRDGRRAHVSQAILL